MSIVDILAAAQGGGYFANAGRAAGLSAADAEAAIGVLAPAIAAKLKSKAAADPDAFDQLLDLLEEGGDSSDLDDVESTTGPEAVEDGNAILADLYGEGAGATLAKLVPGVSGKSLTTISAIAATSVLASLASANATGLASDTSRVAENAGGGGLISIIIAAVMKGLMQGAARQLAPRRRRRRRYTSYYGTRRRPTRRRTRRPGLDDIFKDIIGANRR
jgi:hypothetical protein